MRGSLKKIGEFGWIDELRKKTKTDKSSVILGIGDDAAILRPRRGYDLLLTTDMILENKHFRLKEASAYQIGRKSLAVNISDIAAMGGAPKHAVLSVGLPLSLGKGYADALYKGIQDLASEFKINIVGGDTNRSDSLVLSIALIGEAPKGKSITRSGARPGDVLFVTGSLGGSYQSKKHLNFTPRLKESRYLVKNFKVHAMMDISDGLASDLTRMAKESGVGFLLSSEAIPVSHKKISLNRALTDGEDFELLFALSKKDAERLNALGWIKGLAPFHPIGRVVKKSEGIYMMAGSKKERILERGFNHFNV